MTLKKSKSKFDCYFEVGDKIPSKLPATKVSEVLLLV